jgi:hypothetical protein
MAISAYNRARSTECKQKIQNAACFYKEFSLFHEKREKYQQLKQKCPLVSKLIKNPIGCLKISELENYIRKNIASVAVITEKGIKNRQLCRDVCLTYFSGKYIAFDAYQNCICFEKKPSYIEYAKCYNESETAFFYSTGYQGN